MGAHQFLFDCEKGKVTRTLLRVYSFRGHRLSSSIQGARIIDDIAFEAGPGELNCIMGVSGAGKSTLLKLMLGYLKPERKKKQGIARSFFRTRASQGNSDEVGCVLINGVNLHKNFHYLKKNIAYVPQEDLLFDNLSVYQNLYYAAKLRMPDKSKIEIEHQVVSVLKDVGLFDKKDERVGSVVDKVLSGGQRKRLNIAFELLSNPDIYFLDEPTSGLSSIDSENVIQLLSDLSRRGKIIYVVIHQPSSEIYKKFDNLLLLDAGGKLAFYGAHIKRWIISRRFYRRKMR
jgi:ABC-type multidrug transport system ATPase subunit